MIPTHEPLAFRLIVCGVFRFPDGRTLTRTGTRRVTGNSSDVECTAIVYQELREELHDACYSFREGHGVLIELLGASTL